MDGLIWADALMLSFVASRGSRRPRPMQEIGRAPTLLPILTPLPPLSCSFIPYAGSFFTISVTLPLPPASHMPQEEAKFGGEGGKAYPFFKSTKTLSAKALRAI